MRHVSQEKPETREDTCALVLLQLSETERLIASVTTMHYDFNAIADADVPQAVDPTFQHALTTYASEANKTVSVWRGRARWPA
jgi:hypothetical protein